MSKSSRFASNGAPQIEPIPVEVAALLAAQATVCEGLLAVDMDTAPGCLPELVEQLVVQQNRLAAVVCRFMAGLSKHGDPDAVGRFTASAWLQSRTRMSQAEASRIAKVSARVFSDDSNLPRTRAEFCAGRIQATHAEEIAKAADKCGPEAMAKFDIENQLADVAIAFPAKDVKKLAAEIDEFLTPDTHEEDEKTNYDRRALAAVSTFDNTVDIRGFGAGLEGEEVLDFFRRITIAPQGAEDTRTKAQRCFDGLVDHIRSYTDTLPSMGGFRPGIIVATEYSELMRELGRHTGQHIPAEPTINDIRRIIAAHTGVHPDQILYNEEAGGTGEDEDAEELDDDDVADELLDDETSAKHDGDGEIHANPTNSNDDTTDIDIHKSDVDNQGSRRSIPRQRPAPTTTTPLNRQPNTGVQPGSTLPTTGSPTTRMPTWKEFVDAAERITDPNIRHLLNGAAATAAWAEAPHVSTRPPGTRTLNGHPVSAGTLRRLLCDAKILPAIFDGRGQILDLGAAKRIFSVAQRRALVLRDKHCRWKGCTMPHQYCQAHHVVPVEFHGPTNIDDGILLCGHHHHRSHDKTVDVLKFLDLPESVRQLAAYYTKLGEDRRR